jgi:hypothetical protein
MNKPLATHQLGLNEAFKTYEEMSRLADSASPGQNGFVLGAVLADREKR